MNIIEALKSVENYVVLQTASKKRWMYWHDHSGYWLVKEGRRGGSRILTQTRDEEEAVRVLLEANNGPSMQRLR
jgi:hypothetical protein